MNVDRLKAKIIKVLKKSNLDVEFDDTTSYDNGAGQTYQFFIEKQIHFFLTLKTTLNRLKVIWNLLIFRFGTMKQTVTLTSISHSNMTMLLMSNLACKI